MEKDDTFQEVDTSNDIPESNDFLSAEWDNPDEDEYSLISNELREREEGSGASPITGIYEDNSTVDGGGWSALERYEDGLRGPSMLTMSEATELQSLHSQALDNNNQLKEELDQYKRRLKRRTELVGTMRMAYLKDVILLKNVLTKELNDKERKDVMANFEESLPSFDMRQPLALYAPKDTHMEFSPCETCGGTVEILMKDSKRLQKLEENVKKAKTTIAHLLEEKAIADEKRNIVERNLMELNSKRDMEKKLLYEEIKRCKVDTEKANSDKNASINRMEVLNSKVNELEADAKRAKHMRMELEDVHNQNNKRKSEIEHLQSKQRDMTEQIDEFEKTLTEKEEEIEKKSFEIEEKDKQIEELTSKLEHTEHALTEKRDELHTTQQDLTANREKLAKVSEDKRQLTMAHMEEIEKIKESASGIQQQLQQSKNEATEKGLQILDQLVQIDKIRIEREISMMTTEDKDHMILHLEDEVHHLESEVESLHIDHDVAAQEIEQMKTYIAELETNGAHSGMSSRPESRQLGDGSDYDYTPSSSRPQTRQTDDEDGESGIDNAEKEAIKQAKLAELAAEEAAAHAERERQEQMVKDLEAQLQAMMKEHENALGEALDSHQSALNEAMKSKELEQEAALRAAEQEKQALLEKAEIERQKTLKDEAEKMEALLKQNEEAEKIAEQQRLELEEKLKKQEEEEAAARAALEGASEEAKAKMEAEAREKHEQLEAQLAAAKSAAQSKREEQKAEKEKLAQMEKEMKEAAENAAAAHAAAEEAAKEKVAAAEAAAKAAVEEAAKIASEANADADSKLAQAVSESTQANDALSKEKAEMKAKALADMAALKAQLNAAMNAKNEAEKKEESIKLQETSLIESKSSKSTGRSRSRRESKRGGSRRSRKSRSNDNNTDGNDPSALEVGKKEETSAPAAPAAPAKKKREEKVELIALRDGASPEEAMLYQEFLDACINGLGPGTGKKAMNALINSTLLDRLAELMKNSCSRLMDSFTTLRNIGDYIPKLINILYVLTIAKRCDDMIEAKKAELKKVIEEDPENHGRIKDIEEEIEQAELNPKVVQEEITGALNVLRQAEEKQSLNWLERHGLSEALKSALAAADERHHAIALKTSTEGTAAEDNASVDSSGSGSGRGSGSTDKGEIDTNTDTAVVSSPDAAAPDITKADVATIDAVVENGQSSQDMIHHAYFKGNIVDINARFVESSGIIDATKAHLTTCQDRLEEDFKVALKEYLVAKTAQLEAPVMQRRAVKAIETKANKQVKVAEKATNKEKSKVEMLKSDVSRYTSTIEELSTQVSEMQAIELDRDRWKEKSEGLEEVKEGLEEEKLGFQQEIRDLKRASARLDERLKEANGELVGNREEVKAARLQMKMNNDRMDLAVNKQSKAERDLQMNLDAAQAAKDRLRENSVQCSVTMADMSTGTEFICPPQMSLRYTASTLGLNTNRKQFPIAMPITNRANKLRYVYNREDPTKGSGPLRFPKPSLLPERPPISIRTATPNYTDVDLNDDNDENIDAPDDSTYNISTLDSQGGGDLDAPTSLSLDSTTNPNNHTKLSKSVEFDNATDGDDLRPCTAGTNATVDTSNTQDTGTNTIHYTDIQHPSDSDKTTGDVRDRAISIGIPMSTPPPSAKKAMDDQLTHTSSVAGSIMSILARKEVPRLSSTRLMLEPEKQHVGRSMKGKKYMDRRKDHMKVTSSSINNKNSKKNFPTLAGTGGASGTHRLDSSQLEGLTLRNYLVDNRSNEDDPYYDVGGDGWSHGLRISQESSIDAYSSIDTSSKIEFGIPQVSNVSNQVEDGIGERPVEEFDDVYEDVSSPDRIGVSIMAANATKREMIGSRDSQTVHLESPKTEINFRDGF